MDINSTLDCPLSDKGHIFEYDADMSTDSNRCYVCKCGYISFEKEDCGSGG